MKDEKRTAQTQEIVSEQKIIQVSFWKAISIISGAILVSVIGTAFTVGAVLNSDHFLLARTVDDVAELKLSKVDTDTINATLTPLTNKVDAIDKTSKENSKTLSRIEGILQGQQ